MQLLGLTVLHDLRLLALVLLKFCHMHPSVQFQATKEPTPHRWQTN